MKSNSPLSIAHRGSSAEAPENTMAAFQLALEQGCDAIELDIQLSQDGEIMVCHDSTLDRTTNGVGKLVQLNASQIRQYDAGSWFHERFQDQKIPYLSEVFELVPPQIMINVEIKMIPEYEGKIENSLLQLLMDKDRLSNVVVSSFDHHCLVRLMKLEPKAKIGLLYSHNLFDPVGYAKLLQVPVYALHPHYKLVRDHDLQDARNSGIQVYPWTVDALHDLEKLSSQGVDGMITNYPARVNI